MIKFTTIISNEIAKEVELSVNEIEEFIEKPSNSEMGYY